jgi:hypothetical protein
LSNPKKIRTVVERADQWLVRRQLRHVEMVEKSVFSLQRKIINLAQQLRTAKNGELLGLRTNLKQSQKIHIRILQLYETEFNATTRKMVNEFDEVLGVVTSSYRGLGEAVKFTNIDKNAMRVLRDGMYGDYIAISESSKQKVIQSIYDQVIGGGEFGDLVDEIESALAGSAVATGRGRSLASLARLFARDMIMNYHQEVQLYKAAEIGMDEFLYVGDIIATTRDFCRRRVGKVYTKKQIESWKFRWSGKSGPALTHRGGYNCRHHWQPVRKKWLGGKKKLDVADWNLEQVEKG